MAISPTGVLWVAYRDAAASYGATVQRYTGTAWEQVGPQGLSTEGEANFESLAIDSSGAPYLAYQASGLTVRKWNGTDWDPLGGVNLFSPQVSSPYVALDSQNTPYVIFGAHETGIARVKKWDGASWVAVGADVTTGMALYTNIAFDANNKLYVAFFDLSNGAQCAVWKFTSGAWVAVGSFSSPCIRPSLAFDTTDAPVLGFGDVTSGGKATVVRYDGSSWQAWGNTGFTAGSVNYYVSLAVNSANTPFLSFSDAMNNNEISTMYYPG